VDDSQANPGIPVSKLKLLVLLISCLVVGYFARPWVDGLIPGRMMKKSMPELGEIYTASAQYENATRNPVIVVPGMMGSKLQHGETGRILWGVFNNKSIDPDVADDVRLLCCPIDGSHLDEFDDGVVAPGVIDTLEIEIAGLSLSHQAYLNMWAGIETKNWDVLGQSIMVIGTLPAFSFPTIGGEITLTTRGGSMNFCSKRKPTSKNNVDNDLASMSQSSSTSLLIPWAVC